MRRLLFIEDPLIPGEGVEAPSDVEVDGVDAVDQALRAISTGEYSALLVGFDATDQESVARLETLRRGGDRLALICVIEEGDHYSMAEALRHERVEAFFASALRSPHSAALLEAAIERASARSTATSLEEQLERRHSELLGLNALAAAVSSSLRRDMITRRALWVFGGLCRRGATALVQIHPPPPLPEDLVEEGDVGEHDETPEAREEMSLHCVGEFAVDSKPVCGEFEQIDWWLDFIYDDEILIYRNPPSADDFPGLAPLLERIGDGIVVLVPIWGQGRALGLFVLGELVPGDELPFTHEALRAMSSQLGGALENARLFEEINNTYRSLQSAQDQLVHAEKFAAMGMLAAEIAHEINNPASFVISNLSVMVDYIDTIGSFVGKMKEEIDENAPQIVEAWEQLAMEHEIAFLCEDLDTLLSRSMGGMQRIHQIVQDLRFFSHNSPNEPGWIDIESLLEATINLARHEAKYRAHLELDFEGVPQIFSDANRLSQVFLNLLVNAAHAIETGSVDDNEIRVATRREGADVVVTIRDTGKGIDPEHLSRIFEPFFTTKEPGEGSGLGLSISRDIVRSLGGEITVTSAPGKGSAFTVVLPIRAATFEQSEPIRESGSFAAPPFDPKEIFGHTGRNSGDA